jgi:hypothetical protein
LIAKHETVVMMAKVHWNTLLDRISPKRKLLQKFRAQWAAWGDKESLMASRHFDLMRDAHVAASVDDKTWRDLEFDEIFRRMDGTVTPVGSQVLYAQLRRYVKNPEILAHRYTLYKEMARNDALREALQLRLSKLSDDANADLADVVFGAPTERPRKRSLIWSWSLLSLALLISVAFFKATVWIWLAVVFVNIALVFREAPREHRESSAMMHAGALMNVADELAALHSVFPSIALLAQLHRELPQRRTVRKTLFWFSLSKMPPISAIFAALNLVFLVDLMINASTAERFFRVRSKLAMTYELVGEIDAMIAVASYLQQFPKHCMPTFVDARALSITDGYHPLLPHGVGNSIGLQQRSALVTGSNMAGKTTFIKMLASNAILAQTVGFFLAADAILPHATVMASIHGAHSVNSGKSHYFAEIETIDRFIRERAQSGIQILAIDEPFSGTNTVERIAVARAVLESLGAEAIVLTTTHDIELQDCLGDSYTLYHFQENPDVDGYFDYQLKPGPARSRNAIRLLKRIGFPDDIVAKALVYAGASVSENDVAPVI